MWKSAASLCCQGTERRTAAWTFCHPIAPWPSWLRRRGRATIMSTLLSLTVSTGRLLLLWPLTRCRAPQRTFGGWSLTTAARPWSCSTNSTSRTLLGWGQSVIYCFIAIDFLDTTWKERRSKKKKKLEFTQTRAVCCTSFYFQSRGYLNFTWDFSFTLSVSYSAQD